MKSYLTFLFLQFYFSVSNASQAHITIYDEISSCTQPTYEDLLKIQNFINFGDRPKLYLLKDYAKSAREFKFIGNNPEEFPQYGDVFVNCDEAERESCILIYSSFNRNYPRGLKRLVDLIRNSDFKGHVLYRLGGWPDIEGGSLRLAHVPYGFKVSFFQEARRKKYKKVLYLDVSIMPFVSLNLIFDKIGKEGYFAMGNFHNVGLYMSKYALQSFNFTMKDCLLMPSCSSGIFGVDFSQEIGRNLIDQWYEKALDSRAFYSPRPEQSALSIILHSNNCHLTPFSTLAHNRQEITEDTLFIIDRDFVKK